ncbi:hypothetical protein RvY_06515 [Ramazzottius varieornatus]|uniref:Uncharacterized protein n=1 Tax=Ramazzottius varieornatus TaxID=947166 RepID=A0A1D1V7J2_RAMVA|nr:hypothetical protein RvY_06515 [Ramazzottius varieornatus]
MPGSRRRDRHNPLVKHVPLHTLVVEIDMTEAIDATPRHLPRTAMPLKPYWVCRRMPHTFLMEVL